MPDGARANRVLLPDPMKETALNDRRLHRLIRATTLVALTTLPGTLLAQVTPAAGYTPPDDTPAIKVGMTWFGDYTYQKDPKVADANGDSVHLSSFNIARAYINITGNVTHLLAFRITPDIARETGAGSSLAGSLDFRLKYAYAQLNLDDWAPKGTWVRMGIQQTPYVDFIEGVYRYRFQGTTFTDREGFLSSSDAGLSVHTALPDNYGDVHVGYYNGETYNKAETNNEKAIQGRATLRPFAKAAPLLRGLRATAFYDGDHYVADAERRRLVGALTFEHAHLNAGFEYLDAKDKTKRTATEVDGKGWSVFATPRTSKGIEALIRHDELTLNNSATTDAQKRKRTIVGVAYWLPHPLGTPLAAIMLDYDKTNFHNFVPAQPTQTKIALHGLVNF